jgi:hypothetical protein
MRFLFAVEKTIEAVQFQVFSKVEHNSPKITCQTEITDPHMAVLIEKDVCRFQVSVNDIPEKRKTRNTNH